ncbi:phage tail tape measure protein [Vescimonas sp.]|uniref:phage tail tape measure protein n=1 Tax=Vescimonas sp. TaxID=2892404 RepID=UPI003F7E775C
MAIFKVTAVPDFSQLKGEIAKLQSSPVTLGVDTRQANVNINATRQSLQKLTETFSPEGELRRSVASYSRQIGEVVQVFKSLNAQTGEMDVTSKKVTQNFTAQAKAAERAAAQVRAAKDAYRAYAAQQSSTYAPTAMQSRIENLSGISGLSGKSAKESAAVFEKAFLGASGKVQQSTTKAAQSVRSVGTAAKESSGFADLMGDSFVRVAGKMALWQVMGNAIAGVKRSFVEALDTMKSVDDEMVTIRKVTGATTAELNKIEKQAYDTASAYGVAADEYLQFVSGFSRAGYGEQASALAELAAKTQIVGDTNAETAQQFLLSVDAAYKYQGNIEQLTKVLDGANEIDNHYASSIQKIAEGLGKVAPIAAQAHVGVDELTAAIGTITAVTQRSGTEAATALRALFLNIIGDTKTEIDEGVTWTTGEIAGLRDVIKLYAKDAYEAAQASGNVINPMKAIAGLSKSMKDGLLTEQQLMEMVSDIGGKLRTSQLLALIQNWDMYESMLTDFAGAAGSADKEVENALDSWTRKTEIFNNKWTEFVSHLVETDTIKGALDGVIGLVELLDTDFGRAVVTAGAASAALVGVAAAIKAIKKAAAAFNLASLNPWVLGIMAVGAAIGVVLEATKSARKSIADFDAEIENANEQLQSNKNRLNEINAIPWNERTSDIIKEKQALESENKELERQIELLEKEELAKAEKNTGDNFSIITDRHFEADPTIGSVEMTTKEKGTDAYKWAIDELGRYNGLLEENIELNDTQITKYNETILQIAEQIDYLKLLKDRGVMLTAQEQALIDAYEEHARKAEIVADAGQTLIESYTALEEAGYITEERYKKLISLYPELASQAVQTSKGYVIQKDALMALMNAEQQQQAKITVLVNGLITEARQSGATGKALYDLVAAQITASKTGLNFNQQVAALKELALQAGYTAEAIAQVLTMYGNATVTHDQISGYIRTMKLKYGKTVTEEEAAAALLQERWKALKTNYTPSVSGGGYSGGGSSSSGESALRKKAQAEIDALKKARDAETAVIDEQIEALKKQNEETERGEKLEELKLNILKKQDALLNARNERTVRQYNAATGQWEWVADPSKVKKAEEDLEDAKKDLRDYEREVELDLAIEELEARKKAIEAAYQIKIDAWNDYLDGLSSAVDREKELLDESVKNNQDAADKIKDLQGAGGSGGSGGGTVVSPGGKDMSDVTDKDAYPDRPSAGSYNNMGISAATIKSMQRWYGVSEDGMWGQASYDAAGYRNASEANQFWRGHYSNGTHEWGRADSYSELKSKYHLYDSGGVLRGMGGIKATMRDEIVLPPDITERLLKPSSEPVFRQRMDEMRCLLGMTPVSQSVAGSTDNRSYTDHSGAEYHINGITMTQEQAERTPIAEIARMTHHLQAFGGR